MARAKTNYTQNTESGINSGIYWSIKPLQSWDKSYYYFSCVETNIYVMIKKVAKEYIISFDDTEVNAFRTLKECSDYIIIELNKLIVKRNEERIRIKKEKEIKESLELKAKLELETALLLEIKNTVKLSYSITVCDNDNLTTQLNKLITYLVEKYQVKLGLPVATKDNYYGYHQDFSNFSVVELENGLCEFTAFIGADIIQFTFNGHSSVNADIVKDIDTAINQYIKGGKIKKQAGKKPALKLADNTNKSAKRSRSKTAIALATKAKEMRNTYTASEKDRKWCPVEKITSGMARVVSKNGKLFVIVIDKFDYRSEIDDTTKNSIKIFEGLATPHGNIDIAVEKTKLAEILETLGNTNVSDAIFSQENGNLIIHHPKGRYELVGLRSDELITMFHPVQFESVGTTENNETTLEVETVVTENTLEVTESPVIDITEGDNYILPTTQKVQLIETVTDNVIICEVVPSETTPETTEISLDDMIGIDLIDNQLFTETETETETEIKPEAKPVDPIDSIKIIYISDKNTDITKSVIKSEIKPEIKPEITDNTNNYTEDISKKTP
jgi:hypothetical protein